MRILQPLRVNSNVNNGLYNEKQISELFDHIIEKAGQDIIKNKCQTDY